MVAASDPQEENQALAEACKQRLRDFGANMEVRTREALIPARILAEDFCRVSVALHHEQVQQLRRADRDSAGRRCGDSEPRRGMEYAE